MSRRPNTLSRLLGYRFRREELLETALTHRSAGKLNNERLEFLGDGVLNFIVADLLYQRFPEAAEGHLSRLRAHLVKEATLAELARHYQLGDHLNLGSGELKSGGFRRDSILSGTLEAVIGAIYEDGGFEAAQRFVIALYEPRLATLPPEAGLKDPKTQLQEYLQARKLPLPEYRLLDARGEAHAQIFEIECVVAEAGLAVRGTGGSRRKAEQDAATAALAQLIEKNERA